MKTITMALAVVAGIVFLSGCYSYGTYGYYDVYGTRYAYGPYYGPYYNGYYRPYAYNGYWWPYRYRVVG